MIVLMRRCLRKIIKENEAGCVLQSSFLFLAFTINVYSPGGRLEYVAKLAPVTGAQSVSNPLSWNWYFTFVGLAKLIPA